MLDISCKKGQIAINCLNISSSENKIIISLLFLNNTFAGYRAQSLRRFSHAVSASGPLSSSSCNPYLVSLRVRFPPPTHLVTSLFCCVLTLDFRFDCHISDTGFF